MKLIITLTIIKIVAWTTMFIYLYILQKKFFKLKMALDALEKKHTEIFSECYKTSGYRSGINSVTISQGFQYNFKNYIGDIKEIDKLSDQLLRMITIKPLLKFRKKEYENILIWFLQKWGVGTDLRNFINYYLTDIKTIDDIRIINSETQMYLKTPFGIRMNQLIGRDLKDILTDKLHHINTGIL